MLFGRGLDECESDDVSTLFEFILRKQRGSNGFPARPHGGRLLVHVRGTHHFVQVWMLFAWQVRSSCLERRLCLYSPPRVRGLRSGWLITCAADLGDG